MKATQRQNLKSQLWLVTLQAGLTTGRNLKILQMFQYFRINNNLLIWYIFPFRQGSGKFGPEQVDPTLCTHIIYAWAHLDGETYKLVPGIPELDIENNFYGKITELRGTGVKVILGAGGLKDSEDDKWMRMTSTPENRAIFIASVLDVVKKWNFDGVQIAWQYPVCKQVSKPEIT